MYVAHFSKGNQANKAAIDRISGSGVYGRDADTIINLTQHQEPDCLTVEFTLRNHQGLDPFVVEWKYPLMVRRKDLNPAQLKVASSRKKPVLPADAVLSLVPTDDGADPIPQDELVSKLQERGMAVNPAKETIAALVDDGAVFKWALPRPTGKAAIAYHQQPQPPAQPSETPSTGRKQKPA